MSDHDDDLLTEVVGLRNQLRLLATRVERAEVAAARSAQGLDELESSLDELAAHLAVAGAASSETSVPTRVLADGGAVGTVAEQPDQIDMDVLFEWVEINVGEWAQRKLPRTPGNAIFCWCSRWYDHPEVTTVLWTLRRAWLEAVVQPGAAMAVYFRDFFYPLVRAVTEATGPMHACTPEEHLDSRFVPVQPD